MHQTVSYNDTHASTDRRGVSIMTMQPSRARAKKVTTMGWSDWVRIATILPCAVAWCC